MPTPARSRLRIAARARILVLPIVAVVMLACEALPGIAPPPVDGTGWRAVEVRGHRPVAGAEPTVHFAGGRIGGSTGCNSFGGEIEIDGDRVQLGEVATTLIGCEPEISEIEAHFTLALGSVDRITLRADGLLVLSGTDGEIILRSDPSVIDAGATIIP